jgi:tRNA modification GTPase
MNALLGRDRAIVCDEPGTTRDTLEESIDLEGMKAVLIDTAGVRDSVESEVEKIGIDRTREALKHSDVALLVVDGSKEPSENDRRVHADLLNDASAEGRLCIPVLSKADLPIRAAFPELAPVEISVVTREGLESLAGRIRAAVRSTDQPEVMITSLRHKEALAKCAEALRAAAVESSSPRWEDRAASRLREALRALDEIAGPAAPDEVLAEIFSRFCVGK